MIQKLSNQEQAEIEKLAEKSKTKQFTPANLMIHIFSMDCDIVSGQQVMNELLLPEADQMS